MVRIGGASYEESRLFFDDGKLPLHLKTDLLPYRTEFLLLFSSSQPATIIIGGGSSGDRFHTKCAHFACRRVQREYLSEPNLDLVVFDYNLVAAQPDVRVGHALASRHVVFQPVPGADDDFAVVDPLEPPVVLRPGDEGA
jgi:hypothetical protein